MAYLSINGYFDRRLRRLNLLSKNEKMKKKIAVEANYKPTRATIPVKTTFGFTEVHLIASQLFL